MSNVYSLADLKSELEKEFAPLELQVGKSTIVVRNVMRLNKAERAQVLAAVKAFDSADDNDTDADDVFDALRTILRTCAANGKGDALVDAIGDDLALAMKIMNLWTEATQPGEASNSPG